MNKLLLVDDELDILRVLSMSLKADGYDVLTASSGEDALAVFNSEKPDIVLTDIKMPGMNGIEVLRKVKKIDEETEVIIITGHGDIDAAIEALKYGASDFINKPVRDEALTIALSRALEKIDIKKQLKEYTDGLEHKIAEATREVRRRSNFQSKLITSSQEGIVATNKDMLVVIYNPGAENIFSFPARDVIEKMSLDKLFPQHIIHLFAAVMGTDNEKKEIPWQETTIPNRNGEAIPVRFSGLTLHEKGRKVGSVTFFFRILEK